MCKSYMLTKSPRPFLVMGIVLAMVFVAGILPMSTVWAGSEVLPPRPNVTIDVNQTDGFGDGELLVFTYFQQFFCTHEPFDDLDNDGEVAAVDPEEFQRPRCVVGRPAPSIDPTGDDIDGVEPFFILVPFFDADNDGEAAVSPDSSQAENVAFAFTLQNLFGFVPDAFDPTPGVDVQCPEPGPPLTAHKGDFGTCTMHADTTDLGPLLAQLGLVPAMTAVLTPQPNHSHIIDGKNFGAIWWLLNINLVNDRSVWPDVDGNCPAGNAVGDAEVCLNSVDALEDAQAAGQVSSSIPTNFFLFFDSGELRGHSH